MWKNGKKDEDFKNIGLKELLCVEEDARRSRTEERHVLCRSVQLLIPMFLRRLKLDSAGEDELSEQETALYDRQIRIWGVVAQRRLNKSHVFVSGLNGTLVESCKNVVLAGVGRLTLHDDRVATEDSLLSASCLVRQPDNSETPVKSIAELCSEFLQDINPMIHISIQKGDLSSFGVEFFKDFDAVVVSCCSQSTKKLVNEKCRTLSRNVAFYTVHCRGSCGEIFIDLNNHSYSKKQKESILYQLKYPSFEEVTTVPWRSLDTGLCPLFFAMRVIDKFEQLEGRNVGDTSFKDLPRVLKLRKELCEDQSFDESQIPDTLLLRLLAETTEFPPVCSILGGVLAQEVIKAVSGKGTPLKNCFFFDAKNGKGIVEDISPA
ncbi:ubiquitin-protein ligase [Lithospermum erythrorhizon]|uniref:Ubiquitin-protein ligase n=1 Tax=Lithospermum erythrorhizon TaxID=34254 RepID=A0AAV3QLL2_LITER